ncbi:MAG: aminotransferase class V-fold PLP-dependent enzyme [Gemmatimonadota bacterium]|nr:MAG: aminotransferase class V-fold PLP-dependent enzyme [Gemmatimonadota bacterium]
MSHRRAFLKQLAAVAGASSVGALLAVDRALAADAARVRGGLPPGAQSDVYTVDPGVIYLNHGSIGTIPRAVQQAHRSYLELCETNPWLYMWGDTWEETREAVRAKAAQLLRCEAGEVALTHNTTEGFNILAQGLPLGRGDEVLFSSLNHPGASICWRHQAEQRGFSVRQFDFPVRDVARLTLDDVLDLHDRHISANTRVLVFPHVDNIVGLRHPMRELAALARERGVAFVAVDGAQTVGMLPVNLAASDVDFYAASPHKWVQAPKGTGLLFVKRAVQAALRPMWVTWGQERWAGTVRVFEDYGTRNLPEVIALGDAVDFQASLGEEAKASRYRALWQGWRRAVDNAAHTEWRSPRSWELSASLFAVEVKGVESTDLFARMNREHGFVFRPFRTHGLNTVRISPNLATSDMERELFLGRSAAVARSS